MLNRDMHRALPAIDIVSSDGSDSDVLSPLSNSKSKNTVRSRSNIVRSESSRPRPTSSQEKQRLRRLLEDDGEIPYSSSSRKIPRRSKSLERVMERVIDIESTDGELCSSGSESPPLSGSPVSTQTSSSLVIDPGNGHVAPKFRRPSPKTGILSNSRASEIIRTSNPLGRSSTAPAEVFSNSNSRSPAERGPSKPILFQERNRLVENNGRSFGTLLDSYEIAHDKNVQFYLDECKISWGVQYELARGVSHGNWSWDDVTPQVVNKLKGPSAETVHKILELLEGVCGGERCSDGNLWKELEREERAIIENESRGIGLEGEWDGKANWYGGRIQQVASLLEVDGKLKVRLERMEVDRRSHRFARKFGSRRFLQLRVEPMFLKRKHKEIVQFLRSRFILCGRVFVPFHTKDSSVYMFETNEDYERVAQMKTSDAFRISFMDFINWHNPLDLNSKQPLSKWSTRFALGISTSVPVLVFERENIITDLDDIYAEGCDLTGKAPAEKVMTDGCGFINGAALLQISTFLGLESCPDALQGRIAGGKGLWLRHPTDQNSSPRIWIRKSQSKINLTDFDHSQRIFDLLAPSRLTSPYHLSRQSIMCMSHNGVADTIFEEILKNALNNDIEALTNWTSGEHAMLRLWDAVNCAGHVTGGRTQRLVGSSGRALGIKGRDFGDKDQKWTTQSVEAGADESEPSLGRDEYSGLPSSCHECALEMIQAGFTPVEFPPLAEKIKTIVKNFLNSSLKKYRIPVNLSLELFAVPDPTGVLNEGEVFFQTSRPLINNETRETLNTFAGPVLVGRNPMRIPTDIQKVNAVYRPELMPYKDVLIFSTHGDHSLASVLSGGDMDGDIMFVIFDKRITDAFNNSPRVEFKSEDFIKENFERGIEKLSDFDERTANLEEAEKNREFQKVLISGLANSQVGIYSQFHDLAVYKFGFDDDRSIRLAHMFELILDSAKSGLKVLGNVLKEDSKTYGNARPDCMRGMDGPDYRDPKLAKRDRLPAFILDKLLDLGMRERDNHLAQFERRTEEINARATADKDLLAPFRIAEELAHQFRVEGFAGLEEELFIIKKHVEDALVLHKEARRKYSIDKDANRTKQESTSPNHTNLFQDVSRRFNQVPADLRLTQTVREVAASYAYLKDSKFALSVAFRDLCLIKARKSGIMPISGVFGEAMSLSGSTTRVLRKLGGDV